MQKHSLPRLKWNEPLAASLCLAQSDCLFAVCADDNRNGLTDNQQLQRQQKFDANARRRVIFKSEFNEFEFRLTDVPQHHFGNNFDIERNLQPVANRRDSSSRPVSRYAPAHSHHGLATSVEVPRNSGDGIPLSQALLN